MAFVTGIGATSPAAADGGSGVVTSVSATGITIAKDSNYFVAGKKLIVSHKPNSPTTWTFSFWFKRGDDGVESTILSATTDKVFFSSNGNLSVTLGGATLASVPVYRDPFAWTHVAVGVDTTNDAEYARVDVYVNGELIELTGSYPALNYGTDLNSDGDRSVTGSAEGFVTDLNFVDGIIVPAEEFGEGLSGTWLPKRYHGRHGDYGWSLMGEGEYELYTPVTSTIVSVSADTNPVLTFDTPNDSLKYFSGGDIVSIIAPSPYDTRANTDQVWSSSIASASSFDSSYPITNAFNGDNSTTSYTTGGVTLTLDLSSLAPLTSIELRLRETANSETFTIGGTAVAAQNIAGADSNSLQSLIGVNSTGTVTISAGSGQTPLTAIKVNGRILVDTGVWDASQNWSDMYSGTISASANIPSAFDGNTNTSNLIANSNGDGNITYTLTGLTAGQSVNIKTRQEPNSASITVNGTVIGTYTGIAIETDCGTLSGTTLDIIQGVSGAGTSDGNRIYYVEVDGAILVDAGAQWNTSQIWSGGATGTAHSSATAITNGFDGNLTSYVNSEWGNAAQAITYTVPSTAFSTLRVYVFAKDATDSYLKINGTNIFTAGESQGAGWKTVTGISSPLTSIELYDGSSSDYINLFAVEVDGAILVDPSVVSTDFSTVVSTDITNNKMTVTSGGSWEASDGSGTVGGNTVATGPLKNIDNSGNLNNWATTASETKDSPEEFTSTDDNLGGATVGNYATLNPLDGSPTLSDNNLTAAGTDAYPTIIPGSGDWYYEVAGTGYTWDGTRANWTPRAGTHNFGQTPFSNTATAGHLTLCTTNLPVGLVADPLSAFEAVTYTGNGDVQVIDTLQFSPDFVWVKRRDTVGSHMLFDSVRTATKGLQTDANQAEFTDSSTLTTFNSDGFTLGSHPYGNAGGGEYVAWCWKANGSSTSTNVNGSITTQTSAAPSLGFSITKFTGTGANATVGHGLGANPGLIIVKNLSASTDWAVYHSGTQGSGAQVLTLNGTAAATSDSTVFQDVTPTSTYFAVGSSNRTNGSGNELVAYSWSEIPGFSSFGSYVGTGSTDGPFINTGFEVAYVLTKRVDSTENWEIRDSTRNPYNRTNLALFAHTSGAEDNGSVDFDLLSNGFRVKSANGSVNAGGGNYIYAAFAKKPI